MCAIIFLFFYQMVVLMLLLNMVIAMFTTTFEKMTTKSRVIWANDNYELVVTGVHVLPLGPFNPIAQLALFIWMPYSVLLAVIKETFTRVLKYEGQ